MRTQNASFRNTAVVFRGERNLTGEGAWAIGHFWIYSFQELAHAFCSRQGVPNPTPVLFRSLVSSERRGGPILFLSLSLSIGRLIPAFLFLLHPTSYSPHFTVRVLRSRKIQTEIKKRPINIGFGPCRYAVQALGQDVLSFTTKPMDTFMGKLSFKKTFSLFLPP